MPNDIKIDPELANNLLSECHKPFIGTQLPINVTNTYGIQNEPKLQDIFLPSSKSTKQTIGESLIKDGKLVKK